MTRRRARSEGPSKNAGRGEGFRKDTGGEKRKEAEGRAPLFAFAFFSSPSLSLCPSKIPTTVGIMEISSCLAFIIFPLLPNYARMRRRRERRKNDARIWVRKELLIRSRIFHRHIYLFVYSLTFFRTQYSRFLGNLIIIFHAKISSSSLENELGMNKVMNKTRFTMFFSNYSSVMLTFPFLENFQ